MLAKYGRQMVLNGERKGPAEPLAKDLLMNVTSFFRDSKALTFANGLIGEDRSG
jgi:hypothetical protein